MPELVDIDVFGKENSDGTGVVHKNDQAIGSALNLWLSLQKGELINNPELSGPLDRLLFKSLSFENLDVLTYELKNAIKDYFDNVLELIENYHNT